MQFDILTLFPNSFSYLEESIIKKAQEKELIKINIHDLRKWSTDKHHKVDDRPFGGGPGMLIQVEPVYRALKELGVYPKKEDTKIILTSAKGKIWNQNLVREYSENIERFVIVCGHYEGFDNRVAENLVDEEVSIGQYVLSGGELPAMVLVDSLIRLKSGVLGSEESSQEESYSDTNLQNLEHPQYTRPEIFKTDEGEEWDVPKILLSGNHAEIEKWKEEKQG